MNTAIHGYAADRTRLTVVNVFMVDWCKTTNNLAQGTQRQGQEEMLGKEDDPIDQKLYL